MFLFNKKGKTKKDSVERIRELSAQRMPEKDIIRKLKAEGYSFQDIERGMLESIRQGVIKEDTAVGGGQAGGQQPYAQAPYQQAPAAPGQPALPRGGDFAAQPSRGEFAIPNEFEEPAEYGGDIAEGEFAPEIMGPAEFEGEPLQAAAQPTLPDLPETETAIEFSPQLAIEELIEGVVNEKWEKLNKTFQKVNDDFESMKQSMRDFEEKTNEKLAKAAQPKMTKELEELAQRFDDMDARIGGLEKAFKQFLPSLTKNIEELSGMVHQVKKKSAEDFSSKDFSSKDFSPKMA